MAKGVQSPSAVCQVTLPACTLIFAGLCSPGYFALAPLGHFSRQLLEEPMSFVHTGTLFRYPRGILRRSCVRQLGPWQAFSTCECPQSPWEMGPLFALAAIHNLWKRVPSPIHAKEVTGDAEALAIFLSFFPIA